MEDLSFHILDIADKVVRAGVLWVEIKVAESPREDALRVEISGDGGTAGAAWKTGMGIQRLAEAARGAGGGGFVETISGDRCRVCALFRLSHQARPPLGDIRRAFQAISESHPEVDLRLEYATEDATYTWDTAAAESFEQTRLPTRIGDGSGIG